MRRVRRTAPRARVREPSSWGGRGARRDRGRQKARPNIRSTADDRRPHRRRLPGHRDREPCDCDDRDLVARFKLLIEYTGTRYSGWQIQKNARTVAGEIDRAVHEATRRGEFEL